MKTITRTALALLAVGLGYSAWLLTHPKALITAPVAAADIPFDTLYFDADEAFTYHHHTGSNLHIPANSLRYRSGKKVRGKVHLLYREFHTAADIFRSGIPMETNGGKLLQSAGMCEIRAFQHTETLELAADKPIQLELANYRNPDGYDFFALDSETNTWIDRGTVTSDSNRSKLDALAALPAVPDEPVSPVPGPEDFVFAIEGDNSAPHLHAFRGQEWTLANTDSTTLAKAQQALKVSWQKANIKTINKALNLYELRLSATFDSGKNKKRNTDFKTKVTPVLKGTDLEVALAAFEQKFQTYDSARTVIAYEEERLRKEADFLSSIQVNEFGFLNCDRLINDETFVEVETRFDFEDELNLLFHPITVYSLNYDQNTVNRFKLPRDRRLLIQNNSQTVLVAVLPSDELAIVSAETVMNTDFFSYSSGNKTIHFETERTGLRDMKDWAQLGLKPGEGESDESETLISQLD